MRNVQIKQLLTAFFRHYFNSFLKLPLFLLFCFVVIIIIFYSIFVQLDWHQYPNHDSMQKIMKIKSKQNHFLIEFLQLLNPIVSCIVSGKY